MMERMAWSLARALEDPEVRQRVLEDMRASRVPEQKLHLRDNLRSARGGVVASRAAEFLGGSAAALTAELDCFGSSSAHRTRIRCDPEAI